MNESEVALFIMAWGPHLDYLDRYCLPSLVDDTNIPLCKFSKIHACCFTAPQQSQEIERIVRQHLKVVPLEIGVHTVPNFGSRESGLLALRRFINFCLERQVRGFFVPPDTIFGQFTFSNIWEYSKHKDVCVSAAHLRVESGRFTEAVRAWLGYSNKLLVDWAFRFAHQSILGSRFETDNGMRHGGLSVGNGSNCKTLIHCLPTVYLARFRQSDPAYFEGAVDLGWWDHEWPSRLIEEGRFRMVGSSEMAFAIELTHPDFNRVEVDPGSAKVETPYHRGLLHNRVCSGFVVHLQGTGTGLTQA